MDAGAGLASDLGDESGVGGRVFAGLGLITGLFFATGLGLPRRRLGACGFNYHMLSNGPAGIHNTGGTKGLAHRRHKLRRRK